MCAWLTVHMFPWFEMPEKCCWFVGCVLHDVFCVIRGQQLCFRGGQDRRSLWRSADLDHQITLVSRHTEPNMFSLLPVSYLCCLLTCRCIVCIKTFISNKHKTPQTTSSRNCFAWQLVFLVFPRWDCFADEPAPCRYSYCLRTPEVRQTGPATVWTSPGSLLWHPEEKHRAVQQLCFPLCLSSLL